MEGAEQNGQSTFHGGAGQLERGPWENAAQKVQKVKKKKKAFQGETMETENPLLTGKGRREWGPSVDAEGQEIQGTLTGGKTGEERTLHGGGRTKSTEHPSQRSREVGQGILE